MRYLHRASVSSLVLLIALTFGWELWLAPIKPGGSWLVLKAIPLLLPLRGIVTKNLYTYRWAILLVLAYVCEGVARAYTDIRLSRVLASVEIVLALTFFTTAIAYVRAARRRSQT